MTFLSALVGVILGLMVLTHQAAPSVGAGLGAALFGGLGVWRLWSLPTGRAGPGVAFFLAVVACLVPEGLRRHEGASWNPAFHPASFGPGDTLRVTFPRWIRSVRGRWRGAASATMQADHRAPLTPAATTVDRDWGSSIELDHRKGSTEKARAYATVEIPDDPDWENTQAELKVRLEFEFPKWAGDSKFRVERDNFERVETVTLGRRGWGRRYTQASHLGLLLAWLLATGACWVAAARDEAAAK